MPKETLDIYEERKLLIKKYIIENMKLCCISTKKMTKALCISTRTFYNRKAYPGTFTIDELRTISELLGLTPIEIASIVLGRDLAAKNRKKYL